MGTMKSWYLDLELGIEAGGSRGMRSAQCAANQEFGFTRNIMRDDDGGAMGITAWIDDRQIGAAVLYFQEETLVHMFRTWVRCTIKRNQLQKVTKVWNWIDQGDHGLTPEPWWDVLRTECPWAFHDRHDTNSCKFSYGRSQRPNWLRLKIDRFRRQPATA